MEFLALGSLGSGQLRKKDFVILGIWEVENSGICETSTKSRRIKHLNTPHHNQTTTNPPPKQNPTTTPFLANSQKMELENVMLHLLSRSIANAKDHGSQFKEIFRPYKSKRWGWGIKLGAGENYAWYIIFLHPCVCMSFVRFVVSWCTSSMKPRRLRWKLENPVHTKTSSPYFIKGW